MNRAFIIFALICAACSGPQQSEPSGDSSRKMLGVDDPVRASDLWGEWTAEPNYALPTDFEKRSAVFDYWAIEDDNQKEEHWAAMFSILDFLRSDARLDDTKRLSLSSLMASLEGSDTQFDATFLVSRSSSNRWEGVVTRFAREVRGGREQRAGLSTITVFLERAEGEGDAFSRVWIWAQPGFLETPPFTLFIDRATGKSAVQSGVTQTRATDADTPSMRAVLDLLTASVWKPMTFGGYVETEHHDAAPPLLDASLGMQVGDRDIDQVYSDTVFPPRFTNFGEGARAK